jgi:DNA-binding transcriptional MerR regulator
MLSIGDFARLGGLSVRMLRHYDAVGLLVPAAVDPYTGYRWYDAGQLARLNRVLALKDLGFTLDQVRSIVDDEVSAEELRGMLRLRRAELVSRMAEDADRLARVERRLRTIESEGTMSEHEYQTKSLDAVRVAEVSETVGSVDEIGQVMGPMFGRLETALSAAGVAPTGPGIAYYDVRDDGPLTTHAAFPVDAAKVPGLDVVELPGAERSVNVVHYGSMATIGDTWQALARHVEESGLRPGGACREIYLQTPADQTDWVTELQQPVVPADLPVQA